MKPKGETGDTLPNRVSKDPVPPKSLEETRPVSTTNPAGSSEHNSAAADSPTLVTMPNDNLPPAPKPPRVHRWPWVLLGLLMIVLFGGAGGWMGYRNAIQLRKSKMEEQRIQTATEHFMLGMQAQNNKQYQIAQEQYVYVIRLDPNFPGAQDKLREVMVTMAVKETPTPVPTVALPSPTPTKDTRPQEDIYNQARQQFAAKDWNGLFATIDSLRQIDPKFHAVEVDDMLYVALRFRGVDKILHQADLEGGLYDLALAEQFGPLDQDAKGYRQWARLYLNGASFWEVDWQKVMQAYEQIYPAFPNMRDSSGMTAIERYRIAAKSYADQLVASGDNCGAVDYYKKSLNAVPDGQLAQTATAVEAACHPATATLAPTAIVTLTPSLPAATVPPVLVATTPPATTPQVTNTPEPTKPPATATHTQPTAVATPTETQSATTKP